MSKIESASKSYWRREISQVRAPTKKSSENLTSATLSRGGGLKEARGAPRSLQGIHGSSSMLPPSPMTKEALFVITSLASNILLHTGESKTLRLQFRKTSLQLYFFFREETINDSSSKSSFHATFASNARFISFDNLKPNPPLDFGWQRLRHDAKAIYLLELVQPFHQK